MSFYGLQLRLERLRKARIRLRLEVRSNRIISISNRIKARKATKKARKQEEQDTGYKSGNIEYIVQFYYVSLLGKVFKF